MQPLTLDPASAEAGRPTLLVVDDTPENLAVLGEILQPLYRIKAASNGASALRIAANTPETSLILLDVMMPDMDGYAVLGHLRENPATRHIPVIFVTAMDGQDDERHGLELGAVDYITKPIKPAIVLARIRTQLELKAARDVLSDQNAYLEREIARRMQENQMIQDVSMRALASLAETRDNETGNHILRTQGYVEVLARQLARSPKYADLLGEDSIALLTKAAPLHDIGKVGIPDHILLKPGKLTPEEWEIMKTHSRLGSDAIEKAMSNIEDHAPLAFLHVAMDIAYSHHERWDGSGYPEGIAGSAIPLGGRLMALADVFDALISKRVYKAAMSIPETIQIIVDGRGSHFDPDVVDAFLACQAEFIAIAGRYVDE
jgi:putative two-component system response regulator